MQVRRTLLVALAIVASFLFPVTGQDLASDRNALLALRSSLAGRTLLWDASQQSPCSWAGVQCQSGRVTSLRFPGASLSGQIPVGILGNLTGLKTLSLRLNALAGQIPPDLASCTGLRNLYLQGNRFSGPIPESLLGLRELVRLSLASNSLSGEISRSFSNLTRLRTLSLENNSLSGSIPAELSLPKLEQFNVSNNLLNGSIPDGLNKFSSAAFLGNSLCGKPLGPCPPDVPIPSIGPSAGTGGESSEGGKRKKLSGSAVAGIAIGCVFAFIFIVILAIFLCRKRGSKRTRSIDMAVLKQQEMVLKQQEMVLQGEKASGDADIGEFNGEYSVAAAAAAAMTVPTGRKEANGGGVRKLVFFGKMARAFDLEDLLRASAEVLGKGTFGTSYKAVLEMGNMVAVKRLKDVNIAVGEFKEKIEAVGAMNHENLVPLRAFYYSNDEKLLVYDYMPMGSLSALLHGNRGAGRTPLNWELRSSIALGVARGIEYLHSQGHHVSHGNIKSSNVLLTKSHNARLSDFGLAHIVGPSVVPTRLAGYRAPEVTDPRRVSQKADVYSFGVLLLELLTGKAPANSVLNEEGIDLPRWVQSVVREEWSSEVFDLELLRYQNAEEEMVELLQLAMDCAAQYPDQRPSIPDARRRIEELSRRSLPDHGPQPDQVDDVEVTSSH